MSMRMTIETDEDRLFRALAAPIRRRILDALRDAPLTTGVLCARFDRIDRCTVMQHLKVLEEAGLIVAERRGRERINHLNALPIRDLYARWVAPYAQGAVEKLAGLRLALLDPDSVARPSPPR
jgi:DNA-binding transcriptional ArsR family regulator